jgi:glyoxylase-like metal-dependent hydrolase (beta-lactamase superfamily II)
LNVGRINVQPVIDGLIVSRLPSSRPLPGEQTAAWQEQHGMFTANGLVESTVGAFVVRTDERLILVDAGSGQPFPGGFTSPVFNLDDDEDPLIGPLRRQGLGDEALRRFASDLALTHIEQGGLPRSLAAIGIRPHEVTDVVLTHLHFDHIGWVSADGAPFFENATIRCAAPDLDYFLAGPPEEAFLTRVYRAPTVEERLRPVLERFQTWDSDRNLFPGVDVRMAPGHTPGSSVVVLSDRSERAMLLGDIIHCPLELTDDDFNFLVDYDQEAAIRVRDAYARELEGSAIQAAASHFPGLRFGRLLPGEGRRSWTFERGSP